jgi:hypothetical protein
LLILSHPHADHYGGFVSGTTANSKGGLLKDAGIISVTTIVDSGYDTYGSYYMSSWVNGVRAYWIGQGAAYYAIENLVDGHTYDAIWNLNDDLRLQWLETSNYATPGGAGADDANDNSIAFDLRYGTYDFILMGDLPTAPEEDVYNTYKNQSFIPTGDTVIFKGCHHGSNGANDSYLLSFLKPTYAWVSAGVVDGSQTSSGPSAQHPYKAARSRIEAWTTTARLWWNGTAGTLDMSIPVDYSSFSIHGEGRKHAVYYYGGALVDPDTEKDTPLESTKWALSGC